MQAHLKSMRKAGLKASDDSDVQNEKAQTIAHLLASRQAVKAQRGGLFSGDERLNNKLPIEGYEKLTQKFYRNLLLMEPEKIDQLSLLAEKGHGDVMTQEFSKEVRRQEAQLQDARKTGLEQAKPDAERANTQSQKGGEISLQKQ